MSRSAKYVGLSMFACGLWLLGFWVLLNMIAWVLT